MVWKILRLGINKFQLYDNNYDILGICIFSKSIYRGEWAEFDDYILLYNIYRSTQFYNLVFFSMKKRHRWNKEVKLGVTSNNSHKSYQSWGLLSGFSSNPLLHKFSNNLRN